MNKPTILLIALGALVITNLVAFCLMAKDKRAAARKQWRVPEATLFIAAACFGALGGVLGMQLLRHKTQHWYFKLFFPVLLVVQLALLGFGAYLLLR